MESPARYVGGVLYVCDRCGAETINAPCACGKPWMRATITTTHASKATTWSVPTGTVCGHCGKPFIYVGDIPQMSPPLWCTCLIEVSAPFWDRHRKIGLNPGNAKLAPDFDEPLELTPARAAWKCPRCHTINAPHADRCDCKEPG